jgi:hypothetical protein
MSSSRLETFSDQLEKAGFAFKPSFYLMRVTGASAFGSHSRKLTNDLDEAAQEVNGVIATASDEPADHSFEITSINRADEELLEINLRWQVPVRYWNPKKVASETVDSLKIGFVLVHQQSKKALVSCHTLAERSHITQIVSRALRIGFQPLVLTKELLDLIGTFDTVRRACYFFPDKRPDRASNITFADDLLASIPEVRNHEESAGAERKLSFYRIPLAGLGERGVGVTSDSAKLWIPSDTPVQTVRDFGVALLQKVTGTLVKMRRSGNFDGLLRISLCFLDWRSAAEIDRSALLCFEAALRYFRHEAKIRAICSVASTIASRGFDGFMDQLRADPLYALQQFPFIGPITSLHLAKNLGIPLAKSDRHLSRLAESCGYTDPQLLCSNIAQFTGDPIDVVDIVLWRFAIITRAGYERFALMAGVAS